MVTRGVLVLVLLVCSRESTLAKPMIDDETVQDVFSEEAGDNQQQGPLPKYQALMEIAKKEYETVHGRILAINMATLGKRKLQLSPRPENPFKNIEKINDGQHLNLYEGDIQMDEDLERYLHMPARALSKRNSIREKKRIWSSKIIPYQIPTYMSHIRQNLLKATGQIERHTCIKFVPYRPGVHRNYITFNQKKGCSSKVGKKYHSPGSQPVSIGNGCNNPSTILHELMHAIGFFHEQSRSDRDRYVRVNWENILKGYSDQFDKYTWATLDNLGKSYDYQSIMHYDRMAFTKNGKPTIVAIGNEQLVFGTTSHGLSAGDIIEINALYNCKAQRYGLSQWSGFTPCDKKCYKTRERFCYNPGNVKYCGGKTNAYGVETDKVKCTQRECQASTAIHGHWGRWSDWSDCSATCDNGVRTRSRKCDNPRPGKFGKSCFGEKNERGVCTVKRCRLGFYDMDFEDPYRPLRMWKNKPGSQINWRTNKGYTTTMETGPPSDHTTGRGYYLYMESSAPATKNYQAILISPPITTTKNSAKCLKFAYFMYGKTTGSLEIKLRYKGMHTRLFYKYGDKGNFWHTDSVTLNYPTLPGFQLEIIATVGQAGYSDIAIDDVHIDDGKCSCQDKYVKCITWARNGECQRNKPWMSDHCQRSCKICNDQTSVTTPNTNCKDTNKIQCPLWANLGACSTNKVWMHKNCEKSCKICQGVPCSDSNSSCNAWAKMGECKKNPAYMTVKCKKSCGLCP